MFIFYNLMFYLFQYLQSGQHDRKGYARIAVINRRRHPAVTFNQSMNYRQT